MYIEYAVKNSQLKHVSHVFSRFKIMLKRAFKLGVVVEMRARDALVRANITRFIPKILRMMNFICFNSIDAAVVACARYIYAYYQVPFRAKCSARYLAMIEHATGFKLTEPSSVLTDEIFHVAKPGIIITKNNVAFNAVFNDDFDTVLAKSLSFADEIGEEKSNALASAASYVTDEKNILVRHGGDILKLAVQAPFIIKNDGKFIPVANFRDIVMEIKRFFDEKKKKKERHGYPERIAMAIQKAGRPLALHEIYAALPASPEASIRCKIYRNSEKFEKTQLPGEAFVRYSVRGMQVSGAVSDSDKRIRVEAGPRRASISHDEQSILFIKNIVVERKRTTSNRNNAPVNSYFHWVRIKKVKEALKIIFETPEATPSKIFPKLSTPGIRGIWREDAIPKYVIYDLFLFLKEYHFAEEGEKKGEPIRLTSTIEQVMKFIDLL